MSEDALVNTGAVIWPEHDWAQVTVRRMQAKLHCWAAGDPGRRFDDLYNLVCDPAFLVVAWQRVAGNVGARTAGIDRATVAAIVSRFGVEEFLQHVRDQLRSRTFSPVEVRQVMIPKASGKLRALGIPTVTDRVVQAALKLVLEPIFEADFAPCSYGFRPNRRAQDAIAEIHHFTTKSYHWVVEADIEACFDMIDHVALMDRVRARIGDKRVLGLVKAFLKAGVMTTTGTREATHTGTPQGGILSPLLANIALSVLDEHFMSKWDQQMASEVCRQRRKRQGKANYRLVRYADDFVILVTGQREHAEQLLNEVAAVLGPDGAATVTGEDPRGPHRPRLRLPRLSHPTDAETGQQQVVRVHQALEEGDRLDQEPGEDHDLQGDLAPRPRVPSGLPGSGTTRVGQLLPTRRVQGHVLRDRLLHVGAAHGMATEEAPHRLARTPAQVLPARDLAARRRWDQVQGRSQRPRHPVPLPRLPDPDPMDTDSHHWLNNNHSWRARCGENRTPGSAGGPGKRTPSNPGTAPRADPTGITCRPSRSKTEVAGRRS